MDALVERLRGDLGHGAFRVTDHWSDDAFAIGLSRPSDDRFLVYISTLSARSGVFAYECERPSSDPDRRYDSDGMVEQASYEDLLAAVARHL